MIKSRVLLVLAVTVLVRAAFAQGAGGGFPQGAAGSGLPSDIDGPRTIPQQFASKLKLDNTQGPAVDQILSAAAAEAAPQASGCCKSVNGC